MDAFSSRSEAICEQIRYSPPQQSSVPIVSSSVSPAVRNAFLAALKIHHYH